MTAYNDSIIDVVTAAEDLNAKELLITDPNDPAATSSIVFILDEQGIVNAMRTWLTESAVTSPSC